MPTQITPVYCDAISHCLSKLLHAVISGAVDVELDGAQRVIKAVGPTKMDLSPEGAFQSSRRQFIVADVNGQMYTVTVAEAGDGR
jgi:hypothetical protein